MLKKWRNTSEATLFRKGRNNFEAGWITCGCICPIHK